MSDLDELYDARNDDKMDDERFEQDAVNIDFDALEEELLEDFREEIDGPTLVDGSHVDSEHTTDQDILMANELYQEEIARENDERLNDLVKEVERTGYVSPDASQELKQAVQRLEESKGIALTDGISKELDIADRIEEPRANLSIVDRYNDSINEAMDRIEKLEREDLMDNERDDERDNDRNEDKFVSSSSEEMSRAIHSVAKK